MDFGRAKPPKENFCTNSNLLWELPIRGSSIKVLGFLKAQAFGYKASLNQISERTSLSVNAILRSLNELEEYELIKVEKVSGFHSKYSFAPDSHYAKIVQEHRKRGERTIETVAETEVPANLTTSETEVPPCRNGSTPLAETEVPPCRNGSTNNTKDNKKDKTNREDYSLPLGKTSHTKYRYDDWHMEMAKTWQPFYEAVLPHLAGKVDLEKWANEIRLTAQEFNLTFDAFKALFQFIEGDEFWRSNAESPLTLRKKNSSGVKKIVNIMKKVPSYKRAASLHRVKTYSSSKHVEANKILEACFGK